MFNRIKNEIERLKKEIATSNAMDLRQFLLGRMSAYRAMYSFLENRGDTSDAEAAEKYAYAKYKTGIDIITCLDDFKAGVIWAREHPNSQSPDQGEIITGDTDLEYSEIIDKVKRAIIKVAPDGDVIVQVKKG